MLRGWSFIIGVERYEMDLLRNRKVIAAAIAGGALLIGGIVAATHHEEPHPRKAQTVSRMESQAVNPKPENPGAKPEQKNTYPLHSNITATEFWVGEPGDADNGYIQNRSSTWVENWQTKFGGVDDPNHRNGYLPAGFTPNENPFYFALPYNDLDDNGNQKPSAKNVPWYNAAKKNSDSILKNHWIEIQHGDKVAYAQWEDAGPFGEDDFDYVFGDKRPANTTNDNAGLDLSPATTDYLGLNGQEAVAWRFVDALEVPAGPWKQVVTNY